MLKFQCSVSSAIVQRYIDRILESALSQTSQVQSSAVDILTFTIKQGLAHPLQSFPVIVALETSPSTTFSARASALHAILHAKHTSLLNARYVHSARASFDYQKRLKPGAVMGYRLTPTPTALLHRWYTLVREKRATRQDFLRAMVKVFDVELGKSTQVGGYNNFSYWVALIILQDDVDFIRYMAENFASFEYKTQEETLTVVKSLTSVLSTIGMQLVEALSPSHLLTQLRGANFSQQRPSTPPVAPIEAVPMDIDSLVPPAIGSEPSIPPKVPTPESRVLDLGMMRSSVIIAMIMLLKTHLKTLYGLSEEYVYGQSSALKLANKPVVSASSS